MPTEFITNSGSSSVATRAARLLAALLVAHFAAASCAASPRDTSAARQTPKISVHVDRVDVGVIVTGAQGRFVTGLQRGDFHVFDDGVEQPLTDFASIYDPAQILLLVEAGPAVYLLEGGHLRAVYTLLSGLSPGDRVAIARYAEAPQLLLNFTPDKQAAAAALSRLSFNLGFGSLNLSSSLSSALDWLSPVEGKKAIVLLSTGVDTSPAPAIASLLARLKTTDVRILAVSLSGELRPAGPSNKKRSKKEQLQQQRAAEAAEGFAQADQQLKAIAEAAGGRVYFPRSANDFEAVYAEIASLVRHEYALGFAPPAHDGKPHTLEVRVSPAPGEVSDSSALRVDHRQAYLAPAP
jgi:VWFA-related protein